MIVWPGHMRRKAKRRVAALWEWRHATYSTCNHSEKQMHALYARAKGYFEARDYVGVEAAYNRAREIIDGENTHGKK